MDAVYAKLNILRIVQVLNHTPAEGDAVLVDEGVLGGVGLMSITSRLIVEKLITIRLHFFTAPFRK